MPADCTETSNSRLSTPLDTLIRGSAPGLRYVYEKLIGSKMT